MCDCSGEPRDEGLELQDLTLSFGAEDMPAAVLLAPTARTVGGVSVTNTVSCVVDEQGRMLPAGVPGDLLVHHAAPALADLAHWLPTGQTASVDFDGGVGLLGRSKDVIVRAGGAPAPARTPRARGRRRFHFTSREMKSALS